MKSTFAVLSIFLLFLLAACHKGPSGKELFEKYCYSCHQGGTNLIRPDMSLRKKVREANGVITEKDVIAKIRAPGPGMVAFDKSVLSDCNARKIARYVIRTF